jgi:radical SAM protein with 4Fe4S-binding SPASM domain
MTKILVVTREIATDYSQSLEKAISDAAGEKPLVLNLAGGTRATEIAPLLKKYQPQIVFYSSLDCLDEKGLDEAAAAGATTFADATDLFQVCQRGRLYECDRTFCRNADEYERARCFTFRLPALESGAWGAEALKKCLPHGLLKRRAFLKICPAAEELARRREREAVAEVARGRRAAAQLLARVDYFFCANPLIRQALRDFGIDDIRTLRDDNFVPFEGSTSAPEARLKARVAAILDAYEMASGRKLFPSERIGPEGKLWPRELKRHLRERSGKWRVGRESSILRMQDLYEKRLEWESRPSHVEFATNNRCNLRCITCSPGGRPETEELTEAEARAITAQVFPRASLVTPSAGSEPLLGDFELIVELCKQYNVQSSTITNAVLLKPDKFRLMQDILSGVQISLDSHEKAVYEKIRVGAKFEPVIENIRAACKLAGERGIYVVLQAIMMTLNWKKMPEYIDFAADLGASAVTMMPLLIVFPELEELNIIGKVTEAELEGEIMRAVEAARRREIDLHVDIGGSRSYLFNRKKLRPYLLRYLAQLAAARYPDFCTFLAHYVKVSPDGSVFPCCRTMDEILMGNIKQKSFEEIWNGERYQDLRKQFFTGKLNRCCRECPIRRVYADGTLTFGAINPQ